MKYLYLTLAVCFLATATFATELTSTLRGSTVGVPENRNTKIDPPRNFEPNGPRAANFVVEYIGFTPQAQAAFQYAVDIWAATLTSTQTIEIEARWEVLDPGVLGSAGAETFYRDEPGLPQNNTWYPVGLANHLTNEDLNGGEPEILASFSSTADWYLGTDGNTPNGLYDFVSVVLHEIGHGLGVLGSASYNGTTASFGIDAQNRPIIYDLFVELGNGTAMTNFANSPSATLLGIYTSGDLFFDAPLTTAAYNGNRPPLYAPNPFDPGSSYSHWDEATFPAGNINSLMTPQIGQAEAIHDPGPLTLAMLQDIGWAIDQNGGGTCVPIDLILTNVGCVDVDGNPSDSPSITIDFEIEGDCNVVDLCINDGSGLQCFNATTSGFTANNDSGLILTGNNFSSTIVIYYTTEDGTSAERTIITPADCNTGGGCLPISMVLSNLGCNDQDEDGIQEPFINVDFQIEGDCNVVDICFSEAGGEFVCVNLPEIPLVANNDAGIMLSNRLFNTEYTFYYTTADGTSGQQSIITPAQCGAAGCAPNDVCATAFPIGSGTYNISNLENCINEGTAVPQTGCETQDGWCEGEGGEDSGVWYSFTVPVGGAEVTLETSADATGTWNDTQIAVFGGCGGLFVGGNDDISTTVYYSSLSFGCGELIGGQTYYVLIDGYNGTIGTCDLQVTISSANCGTPGCTNPNACNYNPAATIDNGSCEFVSCAGCTNPNACNYNPAATIDNGSCEFVSCAGCTNVNACNFDPNATIDNGTCDLVSCYGCTNPNACNYDEDAELNDDSCEFESCAGCTNDMACNYNATATIDDGTCEFDTCAGCIDQDACNYDPTATLQNNSCEYETCAGCLDPAAINYDPSATINDLESCIYPGEEIYGCMDQNACNFDATANLDDESCEYLTCAGCTDETACNYDETATLSDDSCEFETCAGCTDEAAINYDATATIDDGSCEYDCEFPTIGFTSFCEDDNLTGFYVEIDVDALGNGAPYTMTNNQNDDEIQLNFNGTINIGPFDNNSQIVLTVRSIAFPTCLITSPVMTFDCFVGVPELADFAVAVYPNPSRGKIYIESPQNGTAQLELYDLTGRTVASAQENLVAGQAHAWNALRELAYGSYILQVNQGGKIYQQVVVKR